MTALNKGVGAPQFELPTSDGSKFSLSEALTRGPVLAVFFKISCPVCQYALPFYDRIYKAYGNSKFSMVAISQNNKQETEMFMQKFGVTFPVLLDDTSTYPASNAYGLTTVPSGFWIAEDGEIEVSTVGWVRSDFEAIVRKAASGADQSGKLIFQPGEQIADFRAG
ncbi:MAG TPA: TlpA disulfide reductase family protein [Terriglobales bacterium]|nr:TlpA disulfide reductase family protein [Terriglobales bacterium]